MLVKEHDCAEVIDQPDSAALEQAIERVRHDAARREELVRNGLAVVGMFHAPVVAGNSKRIIAETINSSAAHATAKSQRNPIVRAGTLPRAAVTAMQTSLSSREPRPKTQPRHRPAWLRNAFCS